VWTDWSEYSVVGFPRRIEAICDQMHAVVRSDWPELAHKLPPRRQTQRD
jgi:hypothetical protein